MRGKGLWIGIAVVLAIVAGALLAGRGTWATAKIGTVFVAKQTCSCLFVAGRPMDSCRTDYDPDVLRQVTIESSDSGVQVSALAGLISARSEYEPGFGCHPVN